jgi:putative ABC transport system permease protein
MVMTPSSLFVRLAAQHLGHRPTRTLLLALAVAVGGGAVFSASVLRQAIQRSMEVSLDRMGADLMVAPRDTTVNLSAALLTVEPTPHTFDAATARQVADLPGVLVAAPQRYYPLPAGGKTHGDDDLIAFDPARDFTILPWLTEKLDRPFRQGDVILGGRRFESVGAEVRLFGRTFPVYGKLALTGVGPFERSLFVSFETAGDVAAAARKTTGRDFLDADSNRYSAILVRLKLGATPEQFRFAAARVVGVQVISGNGLNTTVRQGMSTILDGAVLFTALILLTTGLMVGILYTGLLSERRRELGLLLAVGMRPSQVLQLTLVEATLTTGLGGACGVILGGACLVLFQRSLGYYFESYQVPFTLPPTSGLVMTGAVSVLVCCAVGLLGALLPACRAGYREPYDLVRGEGA